MSMIFSCFNQGCKQPSVVLRRYAERPVTEPSEYQKGNQADESDDIRYHQHNNTSTECIQRMNN